MIVADTIWQPDLSPNGKTRAKYDRLAQAIRDGITDGQLATGAQLPPVRDLAYRVGVTPGTVARAYRILIDEKRLVAGVGRGTFVAEPSPDPKNRLSPFVADPVPDDQAGAHLLSPNMPDYGQGALIRDGLRYLADHAPATTLMRYPSRHSDLAARQAYLATLDPEIVGEVGIEDIVLSHGGQNAIVMILQTILQGTSPVILVDELSYNGFRSAADLARAEVFSVPWDDDGPDPAALASLARNQKAQVFCTTAEVSNPTTHCTTPARRAQIAQVAQQLGLHVIDDDCYNRTHRIGPSYRALIPDLGWHVTSPSKSLTPALRIGFAIGPRSFTAALVRSATGNSFGVSQMISDLYAYLMAQPTLPGILTQVTDRITRDVSAAADILQGHEVNWAEGTPFIWLTLPPPWRAGAFAEAAKAQGILLKTAEVFAQRDSRMVHAVRIAVNGGLAHDRFVEALHLLRGLLDNPPPRISV